MRDVKLFWIVFPSRKSWTEENLECGAHIFCTALYEVCGFISVRSPSEAVSFLRGSLSSLLGQSLRHSRCSISRI